MKYYLFAILDNICCTLAILSVVGCILAGFLFVGIMTTNSTYDEDDHKMLVKLAKWFYPMWIIIILLTTFIPSQKQMAFIIAAPYIIENQQLQDASKNTADIIKLGTEYLKEVLKDKAND